MFACFHSHVPVGMEVDAVLDSGSEGEFCETIFIFAFHQRYSYIGADMVIS